MRCGYGSGTRVMSNKCLCDADAELEKVMWSRTGSRARTGQDLRERARSAMCASFWTHAVSRWAHLFPFMYVTLSASEGWGTLPKEGAVFIDQRQRKREASHWRNSLSLSSDPSVPPSLRPFSFIFPLLPPSSFPRLSLLRLLFRGNELGVN